MYHHFMHRKVYLREQGRSQEFVEHTKHEQELDSARYCTDDIRLQQKPISVQSCAKNRRHISQ